MENPAAKEDERRRGADWAGRAPRLFVEADLAPGAEIVLDRARSHYLATVLRLGAGAAVLLFNGRDGEWRARIGAAGRKAARLEVGEAVRKQPPAADLHYLFAPLKHARLDYMVQKATELGAGRLRPVLTRRTVAARVNLERMRANAIEAAEQCGTLAVPEIDALLRLDAALGAWDPARALVFADEGAAAASPVEALAALRGRPLAVLVGPEGGFDAAEREGLLGQSFVCPVSLGPRILRADTAAVAALALVQALAGDWPGGAVAAEACVDGLQA